MKSSLTLTIVALLSSIFISIQAQAHGIWFAERATQTALVYGVGADDLDAVKRLPLIAHFQAYDADLNAVEAELFAAGPLPLVVSDEQPPVVTAVLDNGIWSKTADGKWHKKGKDEVPDAIIAEHTMKYAVHLRDGLNKPLTALANQTLQIIPVKYPLPEMMGDKIKLQVLFNGKPIKGAEVKADFVNDPDQKPYRTDKKGMVKIKIRNQGLNVIAAIYKGPADDPVKVNSVEHLATLSFILEHLPE
jgi:nickel transport protein